jgi:uroporphyrin-III C-methyltransferase
MQLGGKGKVYLVGAGPGDPELLTMKALRVLREADVILHDDLVSPGILALIPLAVTIISVGKRCGRPMVTQDEINAMMLAYASSGRTVVRLKSGDSMLFGRAGEEIDAIRGAGLDVEVVPGISAAFAAAAFLQTSLTDRRISRRLVFSTGRHAPAAANATTQVVYMPGSDYRPLVRSLLQEGFSPETPCAVVSAVSLEMQSAVVTTLQKLTDTAPLPAPAILLVGEVLSDRYIRPEQISSVLQMPSIPPHAQNAE